MPQLLIMKYLTYNILSLFSRFLDRSLIAFTTKFQIECYDYSGVWLILKFNYQVLTPLSIFFSGGKYIFYQQTLPKDKERGDKSMRYITLTAMLIFYSDLLCIGEAYKYSDDNKNY